MADDRDQADLGQQVTLLEAACRHLLLRPDDVVAREDMARTIATVKLPTGPDDSLYVRSLVNEVRAHAVTLAFRLEGRGYDCLYIRATTAMLSQALAHLKLQLLVPIVAGRNGRHEFGLSL